MGTWLTPLCLLIINSVLIFDQVQGDITCYLCSTLNTTSSGGSCWSPGAGTAMCTSYFIGVVPSLGIITNTNPLVYVYGAPECSTVVYYNGNRAPYKIERSCGCNSNMYQVTNWVGSNSTCCATSLCNVFGGSAQVTASTILFISLASFAALFTLKY